VGQDRAARRWQATTFCGAGSLHRDASLSSYIVLYSMSFDCPNTIHLAWNKNKAFLSPVMANQITYFSKLAAYSISLPFGSAGSRLSAGFWFRWTQDSVNLKHTDNVVCMMP
jgi:hypothetical protein